MVTEIDRRIGRVVRTEREAAGVSLTQLSVKTGQCKNNLSMLERGKISWSVRRLVEVAEALGRSPVNLLRTAAK